MEGNNLVVNGEEAAVQNEDACTRVVRNIYSFRPLHFTQCMYKNTHSRSEYPFVDGWHRFVVSDSHAYCLLYFDNVLGAPGTHELWSFNYASGRWKRLLDSATLASSSICETHALVSYHNALICSGGINALRRGTECNPTCVLTIGTNPIAMELQVTGNMPVGNFGSNILIHDDYLYLIGCSSSYNHSCDVFRLHLGTRVWTKEYTARGEDDVELAELFDHKMCCDGQFIFVFGAAGRGFNFELEKIPAYHMRRKYWTSFDTLPDEAANTGFGFPIALQEISCVQRTAPGGDVEVYLLDVDLLSSLVDFWRLNLRTKQWTYIQVTVPEPIFFCSAALTQSGCMYSFGNSAALNIPDEQALYKMWLGIPSLKEMCWEALCYYNPNVTTKKLLKMGVPNRFLERFDA